MSGTARSRLRPPDEEARIAALRALQVLDTPPEERFDRIVRLAQLIFGTPIALLTLVDTDRQWCKSKIGLDVPESPRSLGFCPTAILTPDTLVVPNALDDPRFADDPSVTGPMGVRFYAGQPLTTPDGHRIGTLCVVGQSPREVTTAELAALRDLAALAEKELAELLLLEAAVERQRAVESLVTAELQRGLLLRSLPAVLFTVDPPGRITLTEGAGLPGIPHAASEIVNRSVFDVYSDVPLVLDALRQALTGATATVQVTIEESVWEMQLVPLRAADGTVTGATGVAVDVTEREQAINEMRRNEQHLRRVIELLPVAIAALDVTMDGKGTLQFVNQRFVELTGFSADDLPTLDEWYRLVYSDPIARVHAQMHTTAIVRSALTSSVDAPPFERTITRRDGEQRTVEIKVSFIGSTMLALLIDLTEQRATERVLATARDQALEASRLKSEFLATMSHEIRTPMNGVIGMTEILLETDLDAEQREFTSVIQGEAESLLQIINDILDFSKIEAGKLVLDEVDFDPRAVMEGVATALAAAASARSVALTTFVSPDVPARLRGDPIRLRQILTNLVGNAVKFTEDGEVIVRMILDREAGSPWALCCFVSDSGIGIAEDVLGRLFQAFTQADGSTTRKYGGTGLGLAICKRLTELMGGEIGAESHVGQGSTFWFTARFGQPHQQIEPPPVDQAHFAGARILIANGRRTEATILQSYFDAWQLVGEVVENGKDALVHLQRAAREGQPFAAAVVAPDLPDLTVNTLASALAADPLLSATPLVCIGPTAEGSRQATMDPRLTVMRPIRQSQMFDAVVIALLGAAAPEVASTPRTRTQPAVLIDDADAPFVLLVDDNETNRATATAQLRRLGYRVATATNGREAVEALTDAHHTYDLALMDCQMPELDGFATTRAVREHEAATGRRLPIVAMTANAMQGDRERCLASGMDDYLSKPVRLEPLRMILSRWAPRTPAAEPHGVERPD